MYQFVTGILYFTIVGLFAVCWFCLKKWSNRLHAYLFFSAVANLVYNVAYIFELRARDEGTYVTALKIG